MDDIIEERMKQKAKRRRSRFLSWYYKVRRPLFDHSDRLSWKEGCSRRKQREWQRVMQEIDEDAES